MPNISLSARARPNEEVLFQELQGEAVLLNLKTGVYFGLNEIGTRVWQLMAQCEVLSEVLSLMLQEFEVDREQCARDLLEVVEEMQKHGLVALE